MAANTPNAISDEAAALRKKAGAHIAKLRKEAGLSQKKVSDLLGYEYYTTVSQWERGYIRLPTETYEPLARILGQDPDKFTLLMMKYYEPHLYKVMTRMLRTARSS